MLFVQSGLLELFYYSSYCARFKDLVCLCVLSSYSPFPLAVFLHHLCSAFLMHSVILTSHAFHCSISHRKSQTVAYLKGTTCGSLLELSRCSKLFKCMSAVAVQLKITRTFGFKIPLKMSVKTRALESHCPAGCSVDLKWNYVLR